MGHDVHNISNHNLDITSTVNLAQDLAKRFKLNVEFGYQDNFYFDWDGFQRLATSENIILGKVIYPGAKETLFLSDEFYFYHIVYNRYGNNVFRLPYFTQYDYRKEELKETINSKCYMINDFANDNFYGYIYNTSFNNFYNSFYPRWWCFCNAFTEEIGWIGKADWELIYNTAMYKYRKQVKQFCEIIGATETIYLDDQGKAQGLTDCYYNWHTIIEMLHKDFHNSILNIPDFMKTKVLLPKKSTHWLFSMIFLI